MNKKRNRGSLIVAVCLLGVVLLIFLVSELKINRSNAMQLNMASESEAALMAAHSGLEAASSYLKDKMGGINFANNPNDESIFKENHEIDWTNTAGSGKITAVNGETQYKYSIKNGKITAYGKYTVKDGKKDKSVIKKLTANYITDYLGVSANDYEYLYGRYKMANINAIYSYDTQYPMEVWINKCPPSSTTPTSEIPFTYNGSCDTRDLPKLTPRYMVTNNDDSSPDFGSYLPTESFVNEITNIKTLISSIYGDHAAVGAKKNLYYDSSIINIDAMVESYIKNYKQKHTILSRIIGLFQDEEDQKRHFKKEVYAQLDAKLNSIGLSRSTIKDLLEMNNEMGAGVIEKRNDDDGETWRIYPEKFRVKPGRPGVMTGRNIIGTKLRGTVICEGDLIIEPTGDEYPILVFGGTLIVNGTIRGKGAVVALNNIFICLNKDENTTTGFNTDGSLIVHAGNKLYISNKSSDMDWLNLSKSGEQFKSHFIGESNIKELNRAAKSNVNDILTGYSNQITQNSYTDNGGYISYNGMIINKKLLRFFSSGFYTDKEPMTEVPPPGENENPDPPGIEPLTETGEGDSATTPTDTTGTPVTESDSGGVSGSNTDPS